MRVKVAECAALFWDRGKLVWDDYLNHRQFALRPDSERVLRWFGTWRDLSSVAELDGGDHDGLQAVARHLLDVGILIAEGSEAERTERAVLARWRPWGAAARYYHFATRTLEGCRFLDAAADVAREQEKLRQHQPPAPFKSYAGRPARPLPEAADAANWPHPDLPGALSARRSTRSFAPSPVDLADVATILRLGAGATGHRGELDQGPAVFRTSPSAGARAPIELYLNAARVEGLTPGLYHFAPIAEELEQLDAGLQPEHLSAALGRQPWLGDAAALLIYTGVVERSQWRYDTARAYRDILLTLGHLSQTVQLVATAVGLGSIFATAVCDQQLEALLDIDPADELVLGVTAIGKVGNCPDSHP